MSRKINVNRLANSAPTYCWVGEARKICYPTAEEAELAARVAEHDHNIPSGLDIYHCEYGDHWHLKSKTSRG